jgi:hypothetical protein
MLHQQLLKRLPQWLHLLRLVTGSAAPLLQTAARLQRMLRAELQDWRPQAALCLVRHWCLLLPLQQHQAAVLAMQAAIAAQVTRGCAQACALRCSTAGVHGALHARGAG